MELIETKFPDYFALPGFCDLHSHFPQYNIIGIDSGTLPEWLNNLVFPEEMKIDDYESAYLLAFRFFQEAMKCGTTCIMAYSTSSEIATDAAFQAAQDLNITAMIGNTMMDRNAPAPLLKSPEENIQIAERLCKKWHNANSGKLKFVVTPRFALSCSEKLLQRAAEFAHSNDLYIQTHLAENTKEIADILKLFPEALNYTDVYRRCGLLGEKTLLAHCIYLSSEEIEMIKDSGATIVHCPSSNTHLRSGIMPFADYLLQSLNLGIGTDVGAGESLSVLAEMKNAIEVAKIREANCNKNECCTASQVNAVTVYKTMQLAKQRIFGNDNSYALFDRSTILANPLVKTEEDIVREIIYKYANKYPDKIIIDGIIANI